MSSARPVQPKTKPDDSAYGLVSPTWLAAHLGDPNLRVVEVDVSSAAHDEWHIDGAVLWNIYRDIKDSEYATVPDRSMEDLLVRSGIEPDSTVVFYGYAPAVGVWLLELYGHTDARILNCSRETWRAEGHPVEHHPYEAEARCVPPRRPMPEPPCGYRRGPWCHHTTWVRLARRAQQGRVRGRALLAIGRNGTERSGRAHSRSPPPTDGRHLRRTWCVPLIRRPLPARVVPRSGRPRRAHHLLHDRRESRYRMVRPHPPSRIRERAGLRRLMGRMGSDP